jgi:hypothetical protein
MANLKNLRQTQWEHDKDNYKRKFYYLELIYINISINYLLESLKHIHFPTIFQKKKKE